MKLLTKRFLIMGVLMISTSISFIKPLSMPITQTQDILQLNDLETFLLNTYAQETSNNDSVLGILYIPGIAMDVVMKSNHNHYYLNHDKNRNTSKKGELFTSKRSNSSVDDMSLIYGHNNADGTKFGRLSLITSSKSQTMYFYDGFTLKTYDLAFAFKHLDGSQVLEQQNLSDSQRVDYLNSLVSKSYYSNQSQKLNNEILLLQTCLSAYGIERLVFAFELRNEVNL